jgi:CRP-like cAMP-binding protein
MLRAEAFRPYPHPRFAISEGMRAAGAPHTPRQNSLLAALSPQDYEQLLPHLYPVPLPLGWAVHGAGDREKHLYFLASGIVARMYIMENGASAGFAVTGSEGAIGIASYLGGETMPTQAVVLSAGYAYRLGAEFLSTEFDSFGPLARILLRYTQALITQMTQTAACFRHHSVEQQLCRWILACLDRSPSNQLDMTHERIADMLGVRREAVTEAAGHLRSAGAIRYGRGHIAVLDRRQLEERACECYSVVKRESDRLLAEHRYSERPGGSWTGSAIHSLQGS